VNASVFPVSAANAVATLVAPLLDPPLLDPLLVVVPPLLLLAPPPPSSPVE
jgi:hypothetical protein